MTSRVQSTPNVTPMVDVMLVLLIIFMVVAPTLLDGFQVQPPPAFNVKDHPGDSLDVTLGIDAAGRYYLNKRPIAAPALPAALDARYGHGQMNSVLYLKADQSLDYAAVLAAVDIARKNGVHFVGMVTDERATSTRR